MKIQYGAISNVTIATLAYLVLATAFLIAIWPDQGELRPNEYGDLAAGILAPAALLWVAVGLHLTARDLRLQQRELRQSTEATNQLAQSAHLDLLHTELQVQPVFLVANRQGPDRTTLLRGEGLEHVAETYTAEFYCEASAIRGTPFLDGAAVGSRTRFEQNAVTVIFSEPMKQGDRHRSVIRVAFASNYTGVCYMHYLDALGRPQVQLALVVGSVGVISCFPLSIVVPKHTNCTWTPSSLAPQAEPQATDSLAARDMLRFVLQSGYWEVLVPAQIEHVEDSLRRMVSQTRGAFRFTRSAIGSESLVAVGTAASSLSPKVGDAIAESGKRRAEALDEMTAINQDLDLYN